MGDDPVNTPTKSIRSEANLPPPPPPRVPSPYARLIVYPLLRVSGIECSLAEVAEGAQLPTKPHVSGFTATDASVEIALDLAFRTDAAETVRRQVIDDKAKWLFALSTVLLTVIAGALTRQASVPVIICGLIALTSLVLVALLLIWYFGLRQHSRAEVDHELLNAGEKLAAQRVVLDSVLGAAASNASRNAFYADVYRAALRLAFVALLAVVAIAPASLLTTNHADQRTQSAGSAGGPSPP